MGLNAADLAAIDQAAAKRAVAIAGAALVEQDMLVGLGTGSTMHHAIAELGRRVAEDGLRFTGVPTSAATAAQARGLGIGLCDPDTPIDLALDGTDEIVLATFDLIKGAGGALLREKMVAQLARRFVVLADAGKVVDVLGAHAALPVEVVPYGLAATMRRIAALGGRPVLRPSGTDNGHMLLDCGGFAPITDPTGLAARLREIAGVVESGLFTGLATDALIAGGAGPVAIYQRTTGQRAIT